MHDKITIVLSLLAVVVGALSLYEEWGRVSQILLLTGHVPLLMVTP